MKDYSTDWDQNEMPAGESRQVAISTLNKSNSGFTPTRSEIASLAYFNYLNRGSKPGDDVGDWLHAETLLSGALNSRDSRGLSSEVALLKPF